MIDQNEGSGHIEILHSQAAKLSRLQIGRRQTIGQQQNTLSEKTERDQCLGAGALGDDRRFSAGLHEHFLYDIAAAAAFLPQEGGWPLLN